MSICTLTLPTAPQAYRAYICSRLGPQMLEEYDRFGGFCTDRVFYVRARYFTTGNWRRRLLVSSAVGFYRSRRGQTEVQCLILPFGVVPVLLLLLLLAALAMIPATGLPISASLVLLVVLLFFTPAGFHESENRLRALLRMAL